MQEPTMQELRDEKLAGDYRDEMTANDMAERIKSHIDALEATNYVVTAELADVMDHPESYFRVVDGRIVKR